jgi:hypothetical protein
VVAYCDHRIAPAPHDLPQRRGLRGTVEALAQGAIRVGERGERVLLEDVHAQRVGKLDVQAGAAVGEANAHLPTLSPGHAPRQTSC